MTITKATLDAFIDDHLNEQDSIRVEKAVRESPELHTLLKSIVASRDIGDHSIGAIWRREHLSCPTREELSSYKEEALDTQRIDYIKFHLEIVGCNACQANLLDLNSAKGPKANPAAREKHRQFLENSKLLLPKKQ
ncbi:MAG: hypothetical protein DWI08_05400 [Planctomycetota bacterium]|jgi:hypothetical protein|nr:hypothetical protein [Gemmataceae bacterium]RLS55505.1 MAG: hypothetical protein DWH95_11440 [Planctomycetota bacterium]RLS87345.1 MAG: hypothetical protein DWI08_05400 [Planctomycetota bacterium]